MMSVDAEQAKAVPPGGPGLYVHVPFCASTCDFCAFYQIMPSPEAIEAFLDGVAAESGLLDGAGAFATIFWGGGTPGLLSPGAIERLAVLAGPKGGAAPEEWTVEL